MGSWGGHMGPDGQTDGHTDRQMLGVSFTKGEEHLMAPAVRVLLVACSA